MPFEEYELNVDQDHENKQLNEYFSCENLDTVREKIEKNKKDYYTRKIQQEMIKKQHDGRS